jgi:hypothetical protein
MKKILVSSLLAIGVLLTQAHAQTCNPPVINSFSPNTGFIGSTVTITGANFDPIPANNQVYFGAVKAIVTAASFGSLQVTVPVGATLAPLSVKNGCNRIAYSAVAFNGIFCPTPITATTYNNTEFTLNANGAYNMLAQDMDLDGKPDVISCGTGAITIARNNSTPGTLNFTRFDINRGGSSVAVADFDGDGRRDIAVPGTVIRNTSVPGTLSFASPQNFAIGGYQLATGDFNNDGRVDIVQENGGTIYVLLNTTTMVGAITFANSATAVGSVGQTCTGLQAADVDGDGRTDILGTQGNANRAVTLRNTTTVGSMTFSFESPEYWASNGDYPYRCMLADFDKDGKIDLTTCNYQGSTNTAIYRNTSTPGDISFAATVNLPAPTANYRIAVGDANGDGYPDIVTKSLGVNVFSVYPNTGTTPGSLSFGTRFDYSSSAMAEVSGIVIADLDGDFVPDIATSGISSNTIRFHRNSSSLPDETPPTAICKSITVGLSPTGTATVTPNMIDNGSGDACGVASIKINGQSSLDFTCANLGANSVTLTVTDRAGNTASCTATVTIAAAAIIVSGQSTVCQGQTVSLSANAGDSYQWLKEGVAISGATAQFYTATATGNYTVSVTNSGGCSGTSAPTTVTIIENPTISTTVSGSTDLCQGNTVTITAGAANIYSWSNGASSPAITVGTAGSYTVTVSDVNGCSATSTPVVVSVRSAPLPTAAIASSGPTTFCEGGATTLTATAASSYQWSNGATTQSINVNQSGTYKVTVTNADGCFATSAPTTVSVKEQPTVNAGADVTTCSTPAQLSATGASATPAAPVLTSLCFFDAPGGTGDCTFTSSLCDDGYQFLTDATYSQTANIATATAIDFKLYYTPCTNVTTFNFLVNGHVIGSFTETNQTCTCTPSAAGQYPRTFSFTPADFGAYWSGASNTLTVEIVSGGSGVAVAGITAQVHSPGEQYTWTPAAGLSNPTIANPTALPAETTTYTVSYTTGNGCTATDQVTVNIQCNTAPVAACAPLIVAANAGCSNTIVTAASFNNGSFDPDGDAITLTVSPAGPYPVGITPVTLTVTDAKGATASCQTLITVIDSTKPILSVPAGITVAAPVGQCATGSIALGSATATDNCSAAVLITNNAPALFPVGTTIVTWTAIDGAGNIATGTQTVLVTSATPPVLTPVLPLTAPAAAGTCGATFTIMAPTAVSFCPGGGTPVVTGVRSDNKTLTAAFPVGTTTITWTATDAGDLQTVSTQTVTVTDLQAPSLTCPVFAQPLCQAAAGTYTIPSLTATDNCGIASIKYVITGATNRTGTGVNASGAFNAGVSIITWTVTDVNGNKSICSTTIVLNTTLNATIPNVYAVPVGGVANTLYIGYGPATLTLTAIPTGGTAPYTYFWSTGATTSSLVVSAGGTYTVTVTDKYGCSVSTSKTIKVIDVRCGNKNDKVLVCQVPPGNPGNAHAICVSANAVPAHLALGSYLGECTIAPATPLSGAARPAVTEEPAALSAYPNPSRGDVTLRLTGINAGPVTIQVLDGKGRVVTTLRESISYKTEDVTLHLGHLAAGIYSVRVASGDTRLDTKIVIIR